MPLDRVVAAAENVRRSEDPVIDRRATAHRYADPGLRPLRDRAGPADAVLGPCANAQRPSTGSSSGLSCARGFSTASWLRLRTCGDPKTRSSTAARPRIATQTRSWPSARPRRARRRGLWPLRERAAPFDRVLPDPSCTRGLSTAPWLLLRTCGGSMTGESTATRPRGDPTTVSSAVARSFGEVATCSTVGSLWYLSAIRYRRDSDSIRRSFRDDPTRIRRPLPWIPDVVKKHSPGAS